ncbi:MAG: hypothetical protein AABW82_02755 [Nanoarchaeota archaeon]
MEYEGRDIPDDSSIYVQARRAEPGIGRRIVQGIAALALFGSLLMAPSVYDNISHTSRQNQVEQVRGLRQKGDNVEADYLVRDIREYIDSSVRHPEHLHIPLSSVYELEAKLNIADNTRSTNAPEHYIVLPGTQMVPFTKRKK